MNINLEKIIELVTKEVIKELVKNGVTINNGPGVQHNTVKTSIEVDMSMYKTPLLSEGSFETIGSEVKELIVPANTIITPGAKYEIKKREIKVNFKN